MASIAIMLGGAVLNASTFIGGSYLAKYLSGTKTDQERRRHDKALERYQRDYAKYQENRQKLLDWQEQNRHEDAIASQNFENTDEALKLYNKFHPDENMQINEPVFSDYYRPSKEQKIGEMASLFSGENNSARVMPSKLLAVVPKGESGVYPELLIPAEKRVINNITLRIENEKFEVPDFNDEEIIYVLKIS